MKKSAIEFSILLDDNNVPERITWDATDKPADTPAQTKSISVSLWDDKQKNTMRIDLWTKDMQVDEMKQFVHQTILTLADSFQKATGETAMAATMRDFCEYYAEKMNIIAPGK